MVKKSLTVWNTDFSQNWRQWPAVWATDSTGNKSAVKRKSVGPARSFPRGEPYKGQKLEMGRALSCRKNVSPSIWCMKKRSKKSQIEPFETCFLSVSFCDLNEAQAECCCWRKMGPWQMRSFFLKIIHARSWTWQPNCPRFLGLALQHPKLHVAGKHLSLLWFCSWCSDKNMFKKVYQKFSRQIYYYSFFLDRLTCLLQTFYARRIMDSWPSSFCDICKLISASLNKKLDWILVSPRKSAVFLGWLQKNE